MDNTVENPSLPPQAYITNNMTAPAFWQQGILWTMLATGDQTGGDYTFIEELCPKDSGPPPHVHEWQDEAIYVVEGEVTFRAGDQIVKGQAGSFVSIPRGTIHNFRVDSETARILNFYAPAALDRFVVQMGTPAQSHTLPPKDLSMRSDSQHQQELLNQLQERYTQKMVETPDILRP